MYFPCHVLHPMQSTWILCPSLPAADPLIPSTASALLPFDLTGVYLPPARRSNWWTKRPTSDLCWQGALHVSRLDNSCMQQILFRTVLALKGCKDQSQLKRCKATTCHPFPQRLCSRFFARLVRRRVSELYPILCRTRVGTKYQETEPDLRSLTGWTISQIIGNKTYSCYMFIK